MNIKLRRACAAIVTLALGLGPLAADAEQQSDGLDTVPLSTIVAAVAKRSGKKFIVDPRVRGDAAVLGENPTALSYDAFLMLLNVHGFAAVTTGEYVRIVPDATVALHGIARAPCDRHRLPARPQGRIELV